VVRRADDYRVAEDYVCQTCRTRACLNVDPTRPFAVRRPCAVCRRAGRTGRTHTWARVRQLPEIAFGLPAGSLPPLPGLEATLALPAHLPEDTHAPDDAHEEADDRREPA
jgi:hypothetical protein